jgi:TonB family protein
MAFRSFLLLLSLFAFVCCDSTAQPSGPVHYSEVDIRPEPIGGFKAFSDQVRFPEMARRTGIRGAVTVHFLVDPNGQATEAVCVADPGVQMCEESLRATRDAGMTPGQLDGRPVAVRECYSFDFRSPEVRYLCYDCGPLIDPVIPADDTLLVRSDTFILKSKSRSGPSHGQVIKRKDIRVTRCG